MNSWKFFKPFRWGLPKNTEWALQKMYTFIKLSRLRRLVPLTLVGVEEPCACADTMVRFRKGPSIKIELQKTTCEDRRVVFSSENWRGLLSSIKIHMVILSSGQKKIFMWNMRTRVVMRCYVKNEQGGYIVGKILKCWINYTNVSTSKKIDSRNKRGCFQSPGRCEGWKIASCSWGWSNRSVQIDAQPPWRIWHRIKEDWISYIVFSKYHTASRKTRHM